MINKAVLRYRAVILILLLAAFFSGYGYPLRPCRAEEANTGKPKKHMTIKPTDGAGAIEFPGRLEISGSYDALSPDSTYGNWKTFSLAYYHKERPELTWYAQASTFARKEGKGQLGAVGAYKTWNPSLSTFTSLSAGTRSDYLPRIRADHEFNFKVDPERSLGWSLGGTYMSYFDEHKDYIVYAGISFPIKQYDINYRIFRNHSDPGAVISYSQLLSVGYGVDREQFTTLTYSVGKQAYLATYLATPEAVSNHSWMLTLNHRQWVESYNGFFWEISYFDFKDAYQKLGFSVGVFNEF